MSSASRDIDLTSFVKEESIPPLYFKRGYFLTPAANSEKSRKSEAAFSPTKLADEQTDRLLKLVKKKQAKRSNVVRVESEERDEGNVIDLVQILKKSLSGKSK